jgi:hypothetical protein
MFLYSVFVGEKAAALFLFDFLRPILNAYRSMIVIALNPVLALRRLLTSLPLLQPVTCWSQIYAKV